MFRKLLEQNFELGYLFPEKGIWSSVMPKRTIVSENGPKSQSVPNRWETRKTSISACIRQEKLLSFSESQTRRF